MWKPLSLKTFAAASICIGLLPWAAALAQNAAAPSLKDQLSTQYKLARAEANSGVVTVSQSGTVLILQKGGLLGVPPTSVMLCASDYKDGGLQPPGGFCKAMVAPTGRALQAGEKVYPFEIDVNPKKDRVSLFFIECDSCNGLNQQSSYKGGVNFDFPKGYLASADVGQIEDVIGQILSIDNGANGAQQDQNAQAQPAPPEQQAPPPESALSGLYFMQQTGAHLQLNPDGSFSLLAANGEVRPGHFTVNGDKLELTYLATGSSAIFTIQGGNIYADTGLAWVRQGDSPVPTASPVAPPTVQLGQTADQVQAILGQPDKIVNLGPKQIYVYKDIKVTFVNGKVTDAE
jgi:hypothetical protein